MLASHALRATRSRFVAISAASMPSTRNGGRSNASRNSACVTLLGPPSRRSRSLKQSTNTCAPRDVAAASDATYCRRSSSSKVWNSPESTTVLEAPPELAEGQGVVHEELGLEAARLRLGPRGRHGRLDGVHADHLEPAGGEEQRVLAGAAARVQQRPRHPPGVGHALERRLRPADVPGRSALVGVLEPARAHPAHLPGTSSSPSLFHRANE